ncbi:MAG: hypothetical protein J7527_05800 [Chitinophagaceae bacterium]|nr:hypothetical protein [Chitinophagaceae bacterium]
MLTKTKMSRVLVFAMAAIALTVYGCSKNGNARLSKIDHEKVLFEDRSDRSSQKPGEALLGANVKKVVGIQADHSVFRRIQASSEWKQASSGAELDLTQIKRTYVYNTDASVVTIPIISTGAVSEYFNVFVTRESVLITKFSESRKEGGVTTCKVLSCKGELYYQFDINSQNLIGNWIFGKELPKLTGTEKSLSLTGRETTDCTKKKFNSCMTCAIADVCGSDWICAIACSVAAPGCVGGAALYCLIG